MGNNWHIKPKTEKIEPVKPELKLETKQKRKEIKPDAALSVEPQGEK